MYLIVQNKDLANTKVLKMIYIFWIVMIGILPFGYYAYFQDISDWINFLTFILSMVALLFIIPVVMVHRSSPRRYKFLDKKVIIGHKSLAYKNIWSIGYIRGGISITEDSFLVSRGTFNQEQNPTMRPTGYEHQIQMDRKQASKIVTYLSDNFDIKIINK